MKDDQQKTDECRPRRSPEPIRKKAYSRPRLWHYGDLRSLTLGGSPGTGDSGAVYTEDPL